MRSAKGLLTGSIRPVTQSAFKDREGRWDEGATRNRQQIQGFQTLYENSSIPGPPL